ncbi:cell surface protein, partial [Mesorhizobium sp. M00.F.Ca.ET.186.01.1.1]
AIAVDSLGNAYITGNTNSSQTNPVPFPITPGAFQTTFGGALDAFVTKLNPAGNALVYSTYLGGDSIDFGSGITVDAAGNAYIVGTTATS